MSYRPRNQMARKNRPQADREMETCSMLTRKAHLEQEKSRALLVNVPGAAQRFLESNGAEHAKPGLTPLRFDLLNQSHNNFQLSFSFTTD